MMTPQKFRKTIYDFYRANGRDLPWRKTRDPYRIFISEVMLQQTQVESVVPKYERFIEAFPDFKTLARSPLHKILALWKGLGYNRRALYLKKAAEIVIREHSGALPKEVEVLKKLPGIGRATASAVAAYAFNRPVVFIETNIRRTFIHHFFARGADDFSGGNSRRRHQLGVRRTGAAESIGRRAPLERANDRCRQENHPRPQQRIDDRDIIPFVRKMLDRRNPHRWYNALMDYGSMLKKQYPNPNRRSRHHKRQKPFEGSDREIRGKILEMLLKRPRQTRLAKAKPRWTERALVSSIAASPKRVRQCLKRLKNEGILRYSHPYFAIA